MKTSVDKCGVSAWNLSWSNSHKVLVWLTLPAKAAQGFKRNMHLFSVMLQVQSHSTAEPIMKKGEKKRPHRNKQNWCRGILLTPWWRTGFPSLVADLHCCWKVQFQSLPGHVFSPSLCVGAVQLHQHRQLKQLADQLRKYLFLWLFFPAGLSELLWVTGWPHEHQYYKKEGNGDTHQGEKELFFLEEHLLKLAKDSCEPTWLNMNPVQVSMWLWIST